MSASGDLMEREWHDVIKKGDGGVHQCEIFKEEWGQFTDTIKY